MIFLLPRDHQILKAMADNKTLKGPADSSRINISEDYEVAYWTDALAVSKEKLAEAVKAVGTSAKDVREHLGK
jgi:hypothetical protein